jgi:Fic family protein
MIEEKGIISIRGKGVVPEYRNIFPPDLKKFYDDEMVSLIGEANREIGNLNSYARLVPNPSLLIGPMLLREALFSSRIEGTEATARDIIQQDAGIELPRRTRGEVWEVINHREATRLGLKLLANLSLSNRAIKRMHKRLMYRVRGEKKRHGEFRAGSNAVATGDTAESIIFLPPPANKVANLMGELENYLNQRNSKVDALIRCALAHYEFEAIHPFADGNGRIGRVLISLFLIKEKILEHPLLYLSGYLLRNKNDYYSSLLKITTNDEWKSWIRFFLQGIREQALRSRSILEEIYSLHQHHRKTVESSIQSRHGPRLVELAFKFPAITASKVARSLDVKHATAMSLLKRMTKLGLLSQDRSKKRDIPFYNEQLVRLLEKK